MILLERVALQDPPELDQRRACRVVVQGLRHRLLIADEPKLLQFRIPDVPEGHEIRPRFFERGVILLQVGLRAAAEAVAQLPGSVTDDFVHRGEQILRLFPVTAVALPFLA